MKKRNILVEVLLLILINFCFNSLIGGAQPSEQWNKTFGGADIDVASSVQQTSDGGYILVGYTNSYGSGNGDAWLIKTDAKGNEMWNKTFGGAIYGKTYTGQQTSDGGYIIAGSTDSYRDGPMDAWLVKTDANGSELWSKTFGGTSDYHVNSVQQTSDDGYVLAGSIGTFGLGRMDALLIKTDINGNMQWSRTFGKEFVKYLGVTGIEGASSVQQTSDGGYILAGSTNSYGAGDSDVWLIKIDADGNERWNRTFGGTGGDAARSVQQTLDGGYILAGSTGSYVSGGPNVWLIRTDVNGSMQWSRTFFFGEANSVKQTSDGGYVLAGYLRPWSDDYGAFLLKTDATGNEQWNKTFVRTSISHLYYSAVQTLNGVYILAGSTDSSGTGESDALLIKVLSERSTQTPTTTPLIPVTPQPVSRPIDPQIVVSIITAVATIIAAIIIAFVKRKK